MRTHSPSRDENDESGNKVPLGLAISVPAQPDSRQAGAPPDDAHCRVLPVVAHPISSPAVFGEGVDASPCCDHSRVVELLGAAGAADPDLSSHKDDGQYNAIADEGGAHDEVGSALADVFALAEPEGSDATKDHLRPAQHRHGFSENRVARSDELADEAVDATFPVALEVQTQDHLRAQQDLKNPGKGGVNVGFDKLATPVGMAEEESENGKDSAKDLGRDVPARLGHLDEC